jgi:hypothetical protein
MAQAAGITTAIRQLMSRGRPPKSTSPVRLAHTELVAALASNIPHPIYVEADSDDLNGRADHLQRVFEALHVYLSIVLADTAQKIRGGTLNGSSLDHLFQSLSADALGVIRNAAEEMREDKNWRAS